MDSVGGLDVEVGDGLGVGEDAGGDHEGEHVDSDQQHGADSEGEEKTSGYVLIYLNLHHGHHGKTSQQSRGSAGGLQFSSAQVEILPLIDMFINTLHRHSETKLI